MSFQLALKGVSKSYGGRPVLDDVTFTVRAGERVAVVGENGAGKSTLLRLIAGLEPPDGGEITVVSDTGIGHLRQTLDLPPTATVQEAVDGALADLRSIEARLRAIEAELAAAGRGGPSGTPEGSGTSRPEADKLLAAYGELAAAFEARGGYEADARVEAARQALGVGGIPAERRLGELSGGEQARLALAAQLAAEPGLLLLDEPTNHLDAAGLSWLEERLRSYRGTVVAVCHDRLFVERVATAILEVDADRRTVVRYGCGYQGYLEARAAARRRWEERYEAWCAEIEELTAAAATTARRVAYGRRKDKNKMSYDRHGAAVQATVSRRVRAAAERLRRLRADPVPRPPDPLRFRPTDVLLGAAGDADAGPGEPAAARPLVSLTDVVVAGRLRVDSLTLAAGDRLLVHGPNGAGKSTLLRVLAGELAPDGGAVERRGRVGYLPQEVPAHAPRRSLLAAFADGLPGPPDEHAELLLATGLFRRGDLATPVGALSVGQRRRLALARLVTRPADLLLLDEPTNHLSPLLVEELEAALAAFPGALVVVSHDRLLHRRFTGSRVGMRAGRILDGPVTGGLPPGDPLGEAGHGGSAHGGAGRGDSGGGSAGDGPERAGPDPAGADAAIRSQTRAGMEPAGHAAGRP